MSDFIKHECGLAFIRLLKPVQYYADKYGTALYGLRQLQLLMQKMRNRGQDGAGLATIKFDMPPGSRYISRKRSIDPQYLKDLFTKVFDYFNDLRPEELVDAPWLKQNKPYVGELYMGHLRYGTYNSNSIETCHPFLRQNNWISRNLVLAGNFNLTNVDELFRQLIDLGQNPKEKSDTVTVLEKIGHFLDDEVERLYNWYKPDGYSNQEINKLICKDFNIERLLKRATRKFDGGFVMGGMIGHGDAFILRDRHGIRPAFYYRDEDVVVMASERPAIQTAFNVAYEDVHELQAGHALIVKKDGRVAEKRIFAEAEITPCSFERIYFSRGTDREIYQERKDLGRMLTDKVMTSIDGDMENTVFSFIPNTAETSFYGLVEGLKSYLREESAETLKSDNNLSKEEILRLLNRHPRIEKLVIKDAKMRTFIADEIVRKDMVSHVYDVTYGVVKNHRDTLVLIDDSIVRGTTLRDSVISIVSRLKPKRLIILSSAPQIRYPDCYGIDMSRMGEFVAFRALVSLLKEDEKEYMLEETYVKCLDALKLPAEEIKNHVKELYDMYPTEVISDRIAQIITPEELDIDVEIIFQTIEGLHKACPTHHGDWYFTGNYPTPGGMKVVNQSFINFMEKKTVRAY